MMRRRLLLLLVALQCGAGGAAEPYTYGDALLQEQAQLGDPARQAWLATQALQPLSHGIADALLECKRQGAITQPQLFELGLRISAAGRLLVAVEKQQTPAGACLCAGLSGLALPPPPFEIHMTLPVDVARKDD